MKIVVQVEPYGVELVLDNLEEENFITDEDTYCHFRDDIFIPEMEMYINNIAPGKWQDTNNISGAIKVEKWRINERLIHKYYAKHNKKRQKYHLYNNAIYFYNFLGFGNINNEIQLLKLDTQDIIDLLNLGAEPFSAKLLRELKYFIKK